MKHMLAGSRWRMQNMIEGELISSSSTISHFFLLSSTSSFPSPSPYFYWCTSSRGAGAPPLGSAPAGSLPWRRDSEEWLYLWSYYNLDRRWACVCLNMSSLRIFGPHFQWLSDVLRFLLLSCIWSYVFSMYFGKEIVNYDINKCYIA